MKGIQSVRVQQHYVQYAGDVMNPNQPPVLRTPSDDNQVHGSNVVKVVKNVSPPSAISSSSTVITSSASNHSFALSEQNDEKSSSQCSRKMACAVAGAQKTDGSGSSTAVVRHTNKYLTESSIRLFELRCPGMTTHERVLNWKIADKFSDVEDDFDESRYKQSKPFRSERVSTGQSDENMYIYIISKSSIDRKRNRLCISVAETHLQETGGSDLIVSIIVDHIICEAIV